MLSKAHYLVCVALLLAASGCFFNFPRNREIRESKHISNLVVYDDHIYFGAGYCLYHLNLLAPSIETIFTTDRVLVEQPIIADGVAYFGGSSYVDQKGNDGENQGFFAVDLQSRKVQWKFPLGVGGYGTYGTFPVLVGERILVCARQHLHCLDRENGRELWKVDNWFGRDSDGVNIPYAYENHVYFKIKEEIFTKSYNIDGHWSKVALDNGKRVTVIPIADNPGTHQDMNGEGIGRLVDGVVYGSLRLSRFGAFDLERVVNFSTVSAMIYVRPLPLLDLVNFLDGTKSLSK